MSAALSVFDDAAVLAEAAASLIIERFEMAPRGRFVLGCPAGRTPLATYRALHRLAPQCGLDLRDLHLVLMDEYVERRADEWDLCPPEAHYSCRGFIERELRQPLNDRLAPTKGLPVENLHVPDPRNPAAYEELIEGLGGVDLFLLASGASDGHVAFNPAGTPLAARTRVVALSQTTRRDNLATFPGFRTLDDTQTHGVSVGPGTIANWSHAALLMLTGDSKAEAFRRITCASSYDAAWPASVVHACANAMIYADRAAAGPTRADTQASQEQSPCGR